MTLPDVGLIKFHPHVVELRDVRCFNPEQIATSGQCFRATVDPTNQAITWVAYGKSLRVTHGSDNSIWFWCSEQDFNEVWCDYFDLRDSYQDYFQTIKEHCYDWEYQIACRWSGLRILRQEPFETLISFMLSTANNIPRIKSLVEAFCTRYGVSIERASAKAFPTTTQLADVTEQDLRDLGMGFRAKYIHQALQDSVLIFYLEHYDNLHSQRQDFSFSDHHMLTRMYGVGDKVAKCVMLYGLGNMNAYPVDTWMKKVHNRLYGGQQVLRLWPDGQPGLDGLLQMYLFYNERMLSDESTKDV